MADSAMPPRLHFEDFAPGSSRIDGGITVSRDDIVAFARRFDPQPFHMDEAAAKQTFVGRLIASGWHTCALTMRIIADGFILDTASMGSPGIEEVRWLRPVGPGGALRVRATVLDARPSQSRPDRGLVRFRFDMLNQTDETAMVQTNWIMVARRGTRLPFDGASRSAETAPGGAAHRAPLASPRLLNLPPGQVRGKLFPIRRPATAPPRLPSTISLPARRAPWARTVSWRTTSSSSRGASIRSRSTSIPRRPGGAISAGSAPPAAHPPP